MSWYLLAGIAVLTLITFVSRAGFWVLPDRVQLPAVIERSLRYAPACALAAIVVPGVLTAGGEPRWELHNPELVATIVAGAIHLRWKNMIVTMTVGMALFTALRLWW